MKQKLLHTVYEHRKWQQISEWRNIQFITVQAGFPSAENENDAEKKEIECILFSDTV